MQDFAPFTQASGALSGPQTTGHKRHLALRGVQSRFAVLGYNILNRSMIHINLIDLLSIIHHFFISYNAIDQQGNQEMAGNKCLQSQAILESESL